MAREIVCPQCGMHLPIDPRDEPLPTEPSFDAGHTIETVIPQTISVDDLGPVPHSPHHPSEATLPHPAGTGAGTSSNGHSHERGTKAGFLGESSYWPSAELDGEETLADHHPREQAGSKAVFPSIRLDRPAPPESSHDDEGPLPSVEHWPEEHRGASWLVVLLGSYASAMTLACAWLWWHGGRPSHVEEDPPAVQGQADAEHGQRGALSENVAPPEEIPANRMTVLGRPLTVGALEITPLEVRVGRVELERKGLDGSYEMRDGGAGALCLRVRLRNRSDDQVFAPLDEAFVREPDRGLPDSFLESPSGERVYLYPLPQTSEWSIVGQEFREIRPGESFETVLISDQQAFTRMVGEATWRLRLRTGAAPGRTELIGVKIDRGQIQ